MENMENKKGDKMETNLKLFIWTGFCPDYTDGLAFAIAGDETEAKKLIIAEMVDKTDNVKTAAQMMQRFVKSLMILQKC